MRGRTLAISTIASLVLGLGAVAPAPMTAAELMEAARQEVLQRVYAAAGLTADGELDEAEARAREALEMEEGIDDPVGDCLVLELLSWIDADRSPTERTAVLLGAARSWWRRIDSGIEVHGPHMAARHDRCVATVRQRLGDDTFQRMSAVGERLTPTEAAAFAGAPGRPSAGLSAREGEVAAGIHQGLSNREIAANLVLSVRTVDTHVQRILAKLGFTSRAQIAAWYQSTLAVRAEHIR